MKTPRKLLTFFVAIIIIALCAGIAIFLIKNRPAPHRTAKKDLGPVVKTVLVQIQDHPVSVIANGTVQGRQAIDITPQVSGMVTKLATNFVLGGFFKQDELFFTIDDTDHTLKLEQTKAELAKAELDYALIEGQSVIARREWQMQSHNKNEQPLPLVVYEPQLRNAKAKIAAASAAVRQAEVNLERTLVRAPFPCFVRSENIDIGQYVRAGVSLARVVGTDEAEIMVSLPLADLPWIQLPDSNGVGGSSATISLTIASTPQHWQGRVSRLLGEINQASRMAQIIVRVEDPYQLKNVQPNKPQLAIGSFVQVNIAGKTVKSIVAIPRHALRDGDVVWLVDQDNTIVMQEVDIVRKDKDQLFIRSGLNDGDRLVVSSLSGAANGLKVRTNGTKPASKRQIP